MDVVIAHDTGFVFNNTNREPVQFHRQHNQTISCKQEERHTAQEVEVVSRAPQPRTHINEDHLSLYDDSSLSDVPDIEGRYVYCMVFSKISVNAH